MPGTAARNNQEQVRNHTHRCRSALGAFSSRTFDRGFLSITAIALFAAIAFLNGCGGQGARSSDPAVTVFTQPYSSAFTGVQSLSICLESITFQETASETDDGIMEIRPRKTQALETQGTDLTTIQVPSGTYKRIELILDNVCGTGESLSLQNLSGSFSSSDQLILRFEGELTLEADTDLGLDLDIFLNELGSITSNPQIRTRLDAQIATF